MENTGAHQTIPALLAPALQRNLLSLNDLTQLADDPAEPPPSVTAVSSAPDMQQLVLRLKQLVLKVDTLEERLSDSSRHGSPSPRYRSPQRRRERSRPRSRYSHTSGVCYYHTRFGNAAINCAKPCSFTDQPLNSTGGC